ncbi:MAPEG family protein [Lysobacter hankyongensis]|uniref:MAPEG family protein n=1 Tax=Lysobacter hankyongensis TaxID=1176535 RepID=A0ABP9CCT1_9GAMM
MAIAYWCILIAAALPYVWIGVGKFAVRGYDNGDPRGWVAKQTHPRVHRGNAAHLNAFEAFAPFAASVLMAQFAGVDPNRIAMLAATFVVFRVLHGFFYLAGLSTFRSLAWFGGIGCVLALMAQAALRVG